jgi:P27 family predicted phage terminase small subunit
MPAGRPRKDPCLAALQGQSQIHSGLIESHIQGSLPRPPEHLTDEEKKAFKKYAKQLATRRAVTDGDATLIGILVVTRRRWLTALSKVEEQGMVTTYSRLDASGNSVDTEKPNLYLKIAETSEKNMLAILDRLGLSPRARELVRQTSPAIRKKEPSEAQRLAAEIAALRASSEEEPAAQNDDAALLDSIDENALCEPQNETQQLISEADAALAEGEI